MGSGVHPLPSVEVMVPSEWEIDFSTIGKVPQVHSARDTKNYVVDPEDK